MAYGKEAGIFCKRTTKRQALIYRSLVESDIVEKCLTAILSRVYSSLSQFTSIGNGYLCLGLYCRILSSFSIDKHIGYMLHTSWGSKPVFGTELWSNYKLMWNLSSVRVLKNVYSVTHGRNFSTQTLVIVKISSQSAYCHTFLPVKETQYFKTFLISQERRSKWPNGRLAVP